MTRHVQLDHAQHRDLRIDTRRSAALGDAVMAALTFPGEFRNLQAHYPIVFRKSRLGEFQPVALFGFGEGQNLFLDARGWDASYVPLAIERQPFLVGVAGDERVVHLDLDSPRVSASGDQALFLEFGGNSAYLDRITSVLATLDEGLRATPAFVALLLQHQLLESFVLDVELDDGSRNRLAGFYTIDEDRLRALDAQALHQLHQAGLLEPVYMALASMSNFRALIERMNRHHAADR
ncbi:SapC family protein [Xanthomonas sp. AmX2]|uniref:SapC family protein n=1 Tax=Xanthomonas sp. TaxID=29446 RepID=UPI00197EF3D7|nr:SapC family protein [Xanthomonas sp.]MBN6149707.1 SapC family protein [Xanthomonas sp.]